MESLQSPGINREGKMRKVLSPTQIVLDKTSLNSNNVPNRDELMSPGMRNRQKLTNEDLRSLLQSPEPHRRHPITAPVDGELGRVVSEGKHGVLLDVQHLNDTTVVIRWNFSGHTVELFHEQQRGITFQIYVDSFPHVRQQPTQLSEVLKTHKVHCKQPCKYKSVEVMVKTIQSSKEKYSYTLLLDGENVQASYPEESIVLFQVSRESPGPMQMHNPHKQNPLSSLPTM